MLTSDMDTNTILSLYGEEHNTDLKRYVNNLKNRKYRNARASLDEEEEETRGNVFIILFDFLASPFLFCRSCGQSPERFFGST